MLQLDVELCCVGTNLGGVVDSERTYYTFQAHRVRRYIHFFVASELVSDVEGLIPKRTHVASKNNKLIRRRWISAFLPPAS